MPVDNLIPTMLTDSIYISSHCTQLLGDGDDFTSAADLNSVHSTATKPIPAKKRDGRPTRTAARAAALTGDLRDRRRRGRARNTAKLDDGAFALALSQGAVADAEQTLAIRIRAHLDEGKLEVKLTDNRYTMLSVRRENDEAPEFKVRLHHMFADASSAITRALALYIGKDDADASRVLGEYIDANQHRVRPKASRKSGKGDTKGACHDLQDIYDSLNARYFDGSINASIAWGQRCGKARTRNSIKMGSYSIEEESIRIHRSLDKAYVPRFFVEWIVYHEMLHQVHQAAVVNGRRQFHTKAFLEDEANFEHYSLARLWERDHLEELLTY